jgi:PAT family beta-lactamase induction signal transducer AmpG
MGLCDVRYTATQFALLTALASVGRVFLAGPLTPPLVEAFGWPTFYLLTVLIALPGLFLLWLYRERIKRIDDNNLQDKEREEPQDEALVLEK